MKKLFSALALFAMTLAVPSCNVEEPEPTNGNVEFLNITYKDKLYKSVPTTYDKDGQFVFLDKEFSAVYNVEVSQLPNLSIFVTDEHDIEFYSSLEETFDTKNLKFVSSVPSNLPQTRAEIPIGSVDIFDKRDCAGDHIMFYLNKPHQMPAVRDFEDDPYHFNDKCSSLILTNNLPYSKDHFIVLNGYSLPCIDISVVFVGYEDKEFSGRTTVITANAGVVNRTYSLPGFDKQLSSFKLFIAQRGQDHIR